MPKFDTPEPIHATIEITGGHVLIRASDRTDTVVDVRPSDESSDLDVRAAEQTRVEYADGRLLVSGPKNKVRSLFRHPPMIEVTVDLPSDSRVDATAWADFRSEGRLGESSFETAAGAIRLAETGRVRLRTAAGDISLGRSTGHTDVSTSAGKIWIGEVGGTAVLKTSNGDITVGEAADDVRLVTSNGDIGVHRALGPVAAKTAFGSVRIGEVVRGSIVLETAFGELELGVREGTAAWLDVKSNHGRVRSELRVGEDPEPTDDTVEVRARTGYGDILIRRP
jgi:hypothetical protein